MPVWVPFPWVKRQLEEQEKPGYFQTIGVGNNNNENASEDEEEEGPNDGDNEEEKEEKQDDAKKSGGSSRNRAPRKLAKQIKIALDRSKSRGTKGKEMLMKAKDKFKKRRDKTQATSNNNAKDNNRNAKDNNEAKTNNNAKVATKPPPYEPHIDSSDEESASCCGSDCSCSGTEYGSDEECGRGCDRGCGGGGEYLTIFTRNGPLIPGCVLGCDPGRREGEAKNDESGDIVGGKNGEGGGEGAGEGGAISETTENDLKRADMLKDGMKRLLRLKRRKRSPFVKKKKKENEFDAWMAEKNVALTGARREVGVRK